MKIGFKITLVFVMMVLLSTIITNQACTQDVGTPKVSTSSYIFYLKNGSILEGEMLKWTAGDGYEIKLPNGNQIKLLEKQVKKLVDTNAQNKIVSTYNFKETGYYGIVNFHFIGSNGGRRANETPGAGISAVYGYQFNRFAGVGIGVGYDKYIFDTGEDLIPVFVDFIGYTSKNNTSPFYHLSLGYGFAHASDEFGIASAKGGLFVNPSLGVRWGAKKVKWLFDVGYRFQDAEFAYGSEFDLRNRTTHDLTYKRLNFSLSLLF